MDYISSTNFMYTRDLSITYCARKLGLSVKAILEAKREDLLCDHSSILLHDDLLYPTPPFMLDYLSLRDYLYPKAEKLFPTVDGNHYYPDKYHRRMQKLLAEAGAKISPAHPKELTDSQYQALVNLRFSVQRQRYQMILAANLCSFLGMRPSEVAKLEKRDIDFSARILYLRDTKSQEDQVLPMLSFLVQPLERYTMHLADSLSSLFVNTQGAQWERRDVTLAIARWGAEHGIQSLTPRKLRASLGVTLSRGHIEPGLLALILRHKDPATALRHYISYNLEEARQFLEKAEIGCDDPLSQENLQEYSRMFTLVGRNQ